MTSVIMIAPMNAANFESGNALDTQALFSDGSGGAEWREPAGEGGQVIPRTAYILGEPDQGIGNSNASSLFEIIVGRAPVPGDRLQFTYVTTADGPISEQVITYLALGPSWSAPVLLGEI